MAFKQLGRRRRTAISMRIVVSIGLIGASPSVSAQEASPTTKSSAPQTDGPTATLPSASSPLGERTDPFAPLNALGVKGWATPYPTINDTILQDIGGLRTKLADAGIGLQGFSLNSFTYDLSQTSGDYRGPQLYNGQKLTAIFAAQVATLTYDTSRIGLEGGQFVVSGGATVNSFERANGPRSIRLLQAYLYQPLLNGTVELKVGSLVNQYDFIGLSVGGNFAGGSLGPQSVIPFQVGLSYSSFGTPAISARVIWSKALYSRTAVQRSLPASGTNEENRINGSGFNIFPGHSTGTLVINEFGYKVDPAPGIKSFWARVGGIYNTTKFLNYRTGGLRENWATYALLDAQITQPDPILPFRGLYVGASVNYAPPEPNLFSRYAEARIYTIGTLKSRPFDLVSLVATYNGYSKYARGYLSPYGEQSYKSTKTLIGSYLYRLQSGLYLQPGIGVVVHPTFAPRYGTSLNGYLGVVALF